MNKPPLRFFETHNFKAIRSSGKIKFDWLTCFIGNNGVGKSSLIEALETFRDVVGKDLDKAMRRWRGFASDIGSHSMPMSGGRVGMSMRRRT